MTRLNGVRSGVIVSAKCGLSRRILKLLLRARRIHYRWDSLQQRFVVIRRWKSWVTLERYASKGKSCRYQHDISRKHYRPVATEYEGRSLRRDHLWLHVKALEGEMNTQRSRVNDFFLSFHGLNKKTRSQILSSFITHSKKNTPARTFQ